MTSQEWLMLRVLMGLLYLYILWVYLPNNRHTFAHPRRSLFFIRRKEVFGGRNKRGMVEGGLLLLFFCVRLLKYPKNGPKIAFKLLLCMSWHLSWNRFNHLRLKRYREHLKAWNKINWIICIIDWFVDTPLYVSLTIIVVEKSFHFVVVVFKKEERANEK